MGIFNKLPPSVGDRAEKTVIAKGTRIVGAIHTDVLLLIDGTVEGEVHSSTEVSIGLNGNFLGTLNAKRVIVSGQSDGCILCDKLEILKSGLVKGEVVLSELTIETGGRFFGQSREAALPTENTDGKSSGKAGKNKEVLQLAQSEPTAVKLVNAS